jgi:hypothetical protein
MRKAVHCRAATQAAPPLVIVPLQVEHESLTDWDSDTLHNNTYDQFSDVHQIGCMLAAVRGLTTEGIRVRDRLLRCRRARDTARRVLEDPYFSSP